MTVYEKAVNYRSTQQNVQGIIKFINKFLTVDGNDTKIRSTNLDGSDNTAGDITLNTDNNNPTGVTGYRGDIIVSESGDTNQYIYNNNGYQSKQQIINKNNIKGLSNFHDGLIGISGNNKITGMNQFYKLATTTHTDQESTNNNPVKYNLESVGSQERIDNIKTNLYNYIETTISSTDTYNGLIQLDDGFIVLDPTNRKLIKYDFNGNKIDESTDQLPENCSGLALVNGDILTAYKSGTTGNIQFIYNSNGFPKKSTEEIFSSNVASAHGIARFNETGWIAHYKSTATGYWFVSKLTKDVTQHPQYNGEEITSFIVKDSIVYGVIGTKLIPHTINPVFNGTLSVISGMSYDLGKIIGSGYTVQGIDFEGDNLSILAKSTSNYKIFRLAFTTVNKFEKANVRTLITRTSNAVPTHTTFQVTHADDNYIEGATNNGIDIYALVTRLEADHEIVPISTSGTVGSPIDISIPSGNYGIAFDGTNFIVPYSNGKILRKYDQRGNQIGSNINIPTVGLVTGLLIQNNKLYLLNSQTNNRKIYSMNSDLTGGLTLVATLPEKNYNSICGDGRYLWVLDREGFRMDCIDPNNGQEVSKYSFNIENKSSSNRVYTAATIIGNDLYTIDTNVPAHNSNFDKYPIATQTNDTNAVYGFMTIGIEFDSSQPLGERHTPKMVLGKNVSNKLSVYNIDGSYSNELEISETRLKRWVDAIWGVNDNTFNTMFIDSDDAVIYADYNVFTDTKSNQKTVTGLTSPVGFAIRGFTRVNNRFVPDYVVLDNSNKLQFYSNSWVLDSTKTINVENKNYVGLHSDGTLYYLITIDGEVLIYNKSGQKQSIQYNLPKITGYRYLGLSRYFTGQVARDTTREFKEYLITTIVKNDNATAYMIVFPINNHITYPSIDIGPSLPAAYKVYPSEPIINPTINSIVVDNDTIYMGESKFSIVYRYDRLSGFSGYYSRSNPGRPIQELESWSGLKGISKDGNDLWLLGSSEELRRMSRDSNNQGKLEPIYIDLGDSAGATNLFRSDGKTYVSASGKFHIVTGTNPTDDVETITTNPTGSWSEIFYLDNHVYLRATNTKIFKAFNLDGTNVSSLDIDLTNDIVRDIVASDFDGENLYILCNLDSRNKVLYTYNLAHKYIGDPYIIINKPSSDQVVGGYTSISGLGINNDKMVIGYNQKNQIRGYNLDGTRDTNLDISSTAAQRVFSLQRDGLYTYGILGQDDTTILNIYYKNSFLSKINLTGFTNDTPGEGVIRLNDKWIVIADDGIFTFPLVGGSGTKKSINVTGIATWSDLALGPDRIYAFNGYKYFIEMWDYDLNYLGSIDIQHPDIFGKEPHGLEYYKGKLYLLINDPNENKFIILPININRSDNPINRLTLHNIDGVFSGVNYNGNNIAVLDNKPNDARLELYNVEGNYLKTIDLNTSHHNIFGLTHDSNYWYSYSREGTNSKYVRIDESDGSVRVVSLLLPSGDNPNGITNLKDKTYVVTSYNGTTTSLMNSRLHVYSNVSGQVATNVYQLPFNNDWAAITNDGTHLYLLDFNTSTQQGKLIVIDPSLLKPQTTSITSVIDGRVRSKEFELGKIPHSVRDMFIKDGILYIGYSNLDEDTAEFIGYEIKKYESNYNIDYNISNQQTMATDGQYHYINSLNKIKRISKHTRNENDIVTLPDTHISISSAINRKSLIDMTLIGISGGVGGLTVKDDKFLVATRNRRVYSIDPSQTSATGTLLTSSLTGIINGITWGW